MCNKTQVNKVHNQLYCCALAVLGVTFWTNVYLVQESYISRYFNIRQSQKKLPASRDIARPPKWPFVSRSRCIREILLRCAAVPITRHSYNPEATRMERNWTWIRNLELPLSAGQIDLRYTLEKSQSLGLEAACSRVNKKCNFPNYTIIISATYAEEFSRRSSLASAYIIPWRFN